MTTANYIRIIALILTIIGALNWGLVGMRGFDLVAYIFGASSTIARIVYGLVGLSGLYLLTQLKGFYK